MNISEIDYSKIIIETINQLFSTLFSSIDNTIYSLLDEITFVDTGIMSNSIFTNALDSKINSSIIAITNSLLIGFFLYYCFRLLYSHYSGINIEKPYQFVFKLILFAICINSSYFLCEFILYVNSLVSGSILEVGKTLTGYSISFNTLINQLNNFIHNNNDSFNLFSYDGIIRSFISFGLINLLFSYSLRYIMIKTLILCSPFAILTLLNQSTSWIFKSWARALLSLLLVQMLIAIILLVILSIEDVTTNTLSELIFIGGIFALSKANSFVKELIGGISTDLNFNLNNLKSLLK